MDVYGTFEPITTLNGVCKYHLRTGAPLCSVAKTLLFMGQASPTPHTQCLRLSLERLGLGVRQELNGPTTDLGMLGMLWYVGLVMLPSGKLTHNYGKLPCLMGNSTINRHFQ